MRRVVRPSAARLAIGMIMNCDIIATVCIYFLPKLLELSVGPANSPATFGQIPNVRGLIRHISQRHHLRTIQEQQPQRAESGPDDNMNPIPPSQHLPSHTAGNAVAASGTSIAVGKLDQVSEDPSSLEISGDATAEFVPSSLFFGGNTTKATNVERQGSSPCFETLNECSGENHYSERGHHGEDDEEGVRGAVNSEQR